MTIRPSLLAFQSLSVLALLACGSAHDVQAAPHAAVAPKSAEKSAPKAPAAELTDAPLASHRTELLTLAFDTASALPTHPHLKNRCRMQEDVVATCLQLDQPRRALSYIEKIDNWRRGSTYADLAWYLSRHDEKQLVDRYLDLADEVAERRKSDPNEQEWRPELIKSKIAAVLVAEGAGQETYDFAARVAELDAMVDHGGLEETTRALMEFAKLYDEHYANETRRNMLFSKVKNSWSKSPVQIRFETVVKLADTALARQDMPTAGALAKEGRDVLALIQFAPEDRTPLAARLADVLRRAGDAPGAREELDAALALYDAHEQQIIDIYRSQALRPIAEQYGKLGDAKKSLEIFARAAEAGVKNPNSRPRADDLQALCCAIARAGVEPSAALMKRLREIRAGLGDPW
jgi:hypothetical protein